MRRECRERFPRQRLQNKRLISDPGMHLGTCATHVPWCMSGSLTRGGGENVTSIPGACATRNFTYLARGPCSDQWMLVTQAKMNTKQMFAFVFVSWFIKWQGSGDLRRRYGNSIDKSNFIRGLKMKCFLQNKCHTNRWNDGIPANTFQQQLKANKANGPHNLGLKLLRSRTYVMMKPITLFLTRQVVNTWWWRMYIHLWRSHLRHFARATTIDEYDVTMPVPTFAWRHISTVVMSQL